MARIFYFNDSGDIYGVHPGAFSKTLPDNVVFIDVPGSPDKIAWPSPDGVRPGSEQWTRVDLVTKELVLWADAVPPPEPDDEFDTALIALKGTGATVDQLIDALAYHNTKRSSGRAV